MKRKAWAVHHFWSTNEPNGYRRGTNQNGFAVIQEVLAQELAQVETSRAGCGWTAFRRVTPPKKD